MLEAQAQAARDAYNKANFEKYQDLAYERYNAGDYYGFLTYSNYALDTGWYNAKLYYDRGEAYVRLKNYSSAAREYKKAKKKGYALADLAIERLKVLRKQSR